MPHSGGGGSHGGGSHGGSHGSHGSSHRTSHHYFPGARRYRRHYNDGRPDEYFYSNGRPQKTGISSLIFMLLFGGMFVGIAGLSVSKSVPKPLNPVYDNPSHYVYDTIDVLDNEDELEDVLDQMQENTGICPIVYTTVMEEYEGEYVDLESFAFVKYVSEWEDEQHYLLIYAIPQDEVEGVQNGSIDIPDYAYEIMMGDETDSIISENIEESMYQTLYTNFEAGQEPGEAITNAFEILSDKTEKVVSKRGPSIGSLMPVIFIGLFILVFIVVIIKNMIKDRGVQFEEVPLTEEDGAYVSSFGSSGSQSFASAAANATAEIPEQMSGTAGVVIRIITILFLVPFLLVGFFTIIGGVAMLLSSDTAGGGFMLVFGILWEAIVGVSIFGIFKAFKAKKKNAPTMTAEYPKADYPNADYPQASYPSQDYGSTTHNDCRSSHEEDEDSVRKGYE